MSYNCKINDVSRLLLRRMTIQKKALSRWTAKDSRLVYGACIVMVLFRPKIPTLELDLKHRTVRYHSGNFIVGTRPAKKMTQVLG